MLIMPEALKRASWLELFYDLAYVALVAQLTYLVARHHGSVVEVMLGILLGYMIFVAWWGTTSTRNLQESEDTTDKLFVQLQMLIALLMSISLPAVFEGDPARFFFFFATLRLVQVVTMYRMYSLYPEHAPRTRNHAFGIAVAAGLWYVCAFLPFPLLFLVAFAALCIDVMTPFTTDEGKTERRLNISHLQERLGLFVILVIGESMLVVAITSTAAQLQAIEPYVILSGMVMMIALWWMYFDYLDRHKTDRRPAFFPYLHSHAALFLGIVFMAAGFRNILLDASVPVGEFVFIGGGFMICMIAMAFTRGARYGWRPALMVPVAIAVVSIGTVTVLGAMQIITTLVAVIGLAVVASAIAVIDAKYRLVKALPPRA